MDANFDVEPGKVRRRAAELRLRRYLPTRLLMSSLSRVRLPARRPVAELEPLPVDEYRDFVARHGGAHFTQTTAAVRWREAGGAECHLLGLRIAGRIEAAGLFTVARTGLGVGRLSSQRGPLIDWTDLSLVDTFLAALSRYATRLGVASLRLNPYLPMELVAADGGRTPLLDPSALVDVAARHGYRLEQSSGYSAVSQVRHHSIIDLDATDDQLLARMSQRRRRDLRKAERVGVVIMRLPPGHRREVWALLEATQHRQGFTSRSVAYHEALLNHFRDDAWITAAFLEGRLLAAAVCVASPYEVVYFTGASADDLPQVGAPTALHWQLMRQARDGGRRRYNLYGVSGIAGPEALDASVAAFKRSLGGRTVAHLGDLVLDRAPALHRPRRRTTPEISWRGPGRR